MVIATKVIAKLAARMFSRCIPTAGFLAGRFSSGAFLKKNYAFGWLPDSKRSPEMTGDAGSKLPSAGSNSGIRKILLERCLFAGGANRLMLPFAAAQPVEHWLSLGANEAANEPRARATAPHGACRRHPCRKPKSWTI